MVKELALSEVLQPFGFRTLNMRLFEYAKVGMLEESALFALCLILLVVYPVIRLDKVIMEHANVKD
jgi:ABC-type Fe3+ transport system permease subunit